MEALWCIGICYHPIALPVVESCTLASMVASMAASSGLIYICGLLWSDSNLLFPYLPGFEARCTVF